jgi:catechol 2,3-dioxygenase-like lactoylglutathione lyase family enzyme
MGVVRRSGGSLVPAAPAHDVSMSDNGGMLGHLGINAPDLSAAKRYYDALMPLVGFEPFFHSDDEFSYRPAKARPDTFLFFYLAAVEPTEYSSQ